MIPNAGRAGVLSRRCRLLLGGADFAAETVDLFGGAVLNVLRVRSGTDPRFFSPGLLQRLAHAVPDPLDFRVPRPLLRRSESGRGPSFEQQAQKLADRFDSFGEA